MKKNTKSANSTNRLADVLICVFFLSAAALCLNMFRLDLMQTINLQNVESVGVIVVKKNTVQRRLSDRVLWDRLNYESPVYLGDLIRVADVSAATLNIQDNSIDLNENTLIRIMLSDDGEGVQIQLSEGTLSFSAGSGGGNMTLNLNGKQVQAAPGAVLSASINESGRSSVQVSEGAVRFVEEGSIREISAGDVITVDVDGTEVFEKAAVVTSPAPNARYLKTTAEPFPVNFSWNRVNILPHEVLRLEIAEDRGFSRISKTYENLISQAQAAFDLGLWYWRLSCDNVVLSEGRLTIADGAGVRLESPAVNSLFRYTDELPVLNFQWSEKDEAVSYVMEVSDTHDFVNSRIRWQGTAFSTADSSLGEGTWFWRVMPVLPDIYEGGGVFSTPSFFRIEKVSVLPVDEKESLSDWVAKEAAAVSELPPEVPPSLIPPELVSPALVPTALVTPEIIEPTPPPLAAPPQLRLTSPANGARIEGLTASRQQTAFSWSCDAEIVSSRFVLSSNTNPLQGRAAVQIQNPGRTVRVDRLGEGTWYWTVEVKTKDGFTVSAQTPRRIQVLPIPLLPPPQNRSPSEGYSFGTEELLSQRSITFNWSAVQGANAYIFTLYQETVNGRRRVIQTTLDNATSYKLDDLKLLDKGDFVWQAEAVYRRGNTIEQRGRLADNLFALDFPSPAPVHIEDTGILYGN